MLHNHVGSRSIRYIMTEYDVFSEAFLSLACMNTTDYDIDELINKCLSCSFHRNTKLAVIRFLKRQ